MNLTEEQHIIAALSQAIADEVPQHLVWQAWEMSGSGQEFDAGISAAIWLRDIARG